MNIDTALAKGLQKLFKELEDRLGLTGPLDVYLAGGMAIHLYTGSRVTSDVDAEFGLRVLIPKDLSVEVTLEDGSKQCLFIDTNYNSTFGLMHEDYENDSVTVDMGLKHIQLHVLSPVDLAVSKIKRLADNDRDDIRQLVRLRLTTADEIEQRALSALGGYIGNQAETLLDIRDAVSLARAVEAEPKQK